MLENGDNLRVNWVLESQRCDEVVQANIRRFPFHDVQLIVQNGGTGQDSHKLRYVVCDDAHKLLILKLQILVMLT